MLNKILLESKKELAYKIFTSAFLCFLILIIPIYWGKIIDGITNSDFNLSYKLIIIIVVISVFYYVWYYINQRSWYKYYSKIYLLLNNSINQSKAKKVDSGVYTNTLNTDIDIVSTFLSNAVTRVIEGFQFIFIFSYFYTLNYNIFIITLLVSLSLILFYMVTGRNMQEVNDRRKRNLDKKTLIDLKNYYKIKRGIKRKVKNNKNESYLQFNTNFNLLTYKNTFIVLAILEFTRYGIIFYSIALIIGNIMELGTLVLVYSYFSKIITNFETLGTINSEYRSFKVSLRRIGNIITIAKIEK